MLEYGSRWGRSAADLDARHELLLELAQSAHGTSWAARASGSARATEDVDEGQRPPAPGAARKLASPLGAPSGNGAPRI